MSELVLADAVRDFLSTKKPATARTYRADLERMVAGLGPSRLVTDVKPLDLIRYWQTVPPEWKVATRNKHIKTIRTFFNWLVKMDALVKSPASAIKLEPDRKLIPRDKAISDADVYRLIEYCKWEAATPRDLALVMFAADTGCRAGEIAGLQWEDVNLDKMFADIDGKSGVGRVAFGAECAKALRRWQDFRVRRYDSCEGYVFNRHGKKILSANISQAMSRICERAGVEGGGIHQFRHRKGHQLADARVAPSTAAAVLRHSDPLITMRHYYPSDWWAAERAMRELVYDPHKQEQGGKTVPFSLSKPGADEEVS
jgi:integrase